MLNVNIVNISPNSPDFEDLIPNSQLVVNADNSNQNKIKVKSDQFLTDPTKFINLINPL